MNINTYSNIISTNVNVFNFNISGDIFSIIALVNDYASRKDVIIYKFTS